ncbi:MAG TPA: L-seryl-tRNA(Sec) selenium transferase, partial [Solirubrobacteraceae bacterium]
MGGGDGAPDALRALPAVEVLAAQLDGPHWLAVRAAREVVGRRRDSILLGREPQAGDLADLAQAKLEQLRASSLRRVLNATGVIVHTNLGRAPLAAAAREAVARAAEGYANLELDLERGDRGSRHVHVADLLAEVTGATDGIAVNNNAGGVLLAVAALAGPGKEVVVSRGQLVEIGGGFRVPEVVAQSGARLVEVGTTNRTRVEDYARAIGPDTGAILRAHPSNFRQLGFVSEVGIEELCGLGVPVIDDVGSGALDAVEDEPPVRRSVAAGAALVCFSADKLLGGPQAGLLVGQAEAVAAARGHPLARALRIDKLSLAALEATLALHRDPETARREIPVLADDVEVLAEEPSVRRSVGAGAAIVCFSGDKLLGGPQAGVL